MLRIAYATIPRRIGTGATADTQPRSRRVGDDLRDEHPAGTRTKEVVADAEAEGEIEAAEPQRRRVLRPQHC